jgi:hypothetical protein
LRPTSNALEPLGSIRWTLPCPLSNVPQLSSSSTLSR